MTWPSFSLSGFIRSTSMTDLAALITQGLWIYGSIKLTNVCADLMLSESAHAESHHAIGFNLAVALLAAWTGKSGLGALSHWGNRRTSREHLEGRAKIEEAKARQPMVVPVTAERPAVIVPPANGSVQVASTAKVVPDPVPARPNGEPNVWTDDERGDPDPNPPNFLLASAGPDSPHNYNRLREPRQGIMLHYDGSTGDKGAVQWLLHDPRCHVSYNWLVLDHGAIVPIAPAGARAWHAGVCQPAGPVDYHDANSAFYGLAFAATQGDVATEEAKAAVTKHCLALYRHHGWNPETEGWRIVSHGAEAWPRGRKVDPEGHPDRPGYPFVRVEDIRQQVSALARVTTV